MAQHQLPCNGDGTCMQCKTTPFPEEVITCSTCATPWHAACLSAPPETLASTLQWECPDCTGVFGGGDDGTPAAEDDGGIVAAIRAIEADGSLTEKQKAKKRQQLLNGGKDDDVEAEEVVDELREIMDESFRCCFCVQLLERPVTLEVFHLGLVLGLESFLISNFPQYGAVGEILVGTKELTRQSFDQCFKESNEALRLSCEKGYPVRVLRSFKDKRSSYAPEEGLQYDGIYRIEKCWRKVGQQGFKVCRYLFVRCDNEPAPWTSDDHGDRPPEVSELSEATDLFERTANPSWDFDEEDNYWKWKIPPPPSQAISNKSQISGGCKRAKRISRVAENMSVKEKLLKEFSCFLCNNVMKLPLTTPCGHNFCKSCLERKFDGQAFTKDMSQGGRSLQTKKNVMNCPACPHDIAEFLQNSQVNREMKDVIEKLSRKASDESKKDVMNKEKVHASKEDVEADIEVEGNEISNPQNEELWVYI